MPWIMQADGAVRRAHHLVDDASRADPVEIVRAGLFWRVRGLGDQRHDAIPAHHIIDQLDGALLPDEQRHDGEREDDGPTSQWQHREDVRDDRA